MLQPDSKSVKYLTRAPAKQDFRIQSLAAAKALYDAAPGNVSIRWNRRTGIPVCARGLLSDSEQGSPQEIADRFLLKNAKLFGIPQDRAGLTFVETKTHRGVQHVRYQQEYERIPVFAARLTVHIDAANRIQMVNGMYCPEIAAQMTAPPISASAAVQAALAALKSSDHDSPEAELVIFPAADKYIRAYQVSVSSRNPLGDWVLFLDAATGEPLDYFNALRFVNGRGMLYNANPERDNQIVTANLFNLNESKTLTGAYFAIKNDASGAGNATPTGPGAYDFLFADPANAHFDEVMAFYHLNKAAQFFRNFGYAEHAEAMPAHVHVPNLATGSPNYDNAYYSPLKKSLFFGHGEKLNDLAKEEAVIYHEYTHSVIDAIQPVMNTAEASALHEGYADYFGCSLTEDPEIGEYVAKKLGKDHLRDLRASKTYANLTQSDVHSDGEIWGATCWKIREMLGRQVADLLIYESLWYLPTNATFADAADAVLQADSTLFHQEHAAAISAVLREQQIDTEPAAAYTILANAASGGKITPSGSVSLPPGGAQTFVIAADAGYYIKHVLVDGVSIGAVATHTFLDVRASHTIEAFFEDVNVKSFTITASAGTGGSISPAGKIAVERGGRQRFTFVPENDYLVKHVLVDGISAGAVTEYVFEQIAASHTIEALFVEDVPVKEATVIGPGNAKWVETGIMIGKGDILRFSASGKVAYDAKGNACAPAGTIWTDTKDRKDPLWQKPHAGLIGKIAGIGAPFFIGGAYAVKAGSNGQLLLGVNDFWTEGNRGEFTVTIRITKATS